MIELKLELKTRAESQKQKVLGNASSSWGEFTTYTLHEMGIQVCLAFILIHGKIPSDVQFICQAASTSNTVETQILPVAVRAPGELRYSNSC